MLFGRRPVAARYGGTRCSSSYHLADVDGQRRIGRGEVLFWIGLAAVFAVGMWLLFARPWDARVDADEAAAQLAEQVGLKEPYRCERDEADETVASYTGGDSDYYCSPLHYDDGDVSYWIGTNDTRITGVMQTAP